MLAIGFASHARMPRFAFFKTHATPLFAKATLKSLLKSKGLQK
jgi:hypothetical protein